MSSTIYISVPQQRLDLLEGKEVKWSAAVSTSRYGLGEEVGSFKTPRGWHVIAQKLGADAELGTIFKARVPVGIWRGEASEQDFVLTRILWLAGEEPFNKTSFERYIYIHGTNHEEMIGRPASHGCIRMKNSNVAELYELVEVGTRVYIAEG